MVGGEFQGTGVGVCMYVCMYVYLRLMKGRDYSTVDGRSPSQKTPGSVFILHV